MYIPLVIEIIQGLILEKATLDALIWGSLLRSLNLVQTLAEIMAQKWVDTQTLEDGKIKAVTSRMCPISNVYSPAIINFMAMDVIGLALCRKARRAVRLDFSLVRLRPKILGRHFFVNLLQNFV